MTDDPLTAICAELAARRASTNQMLSQLRADGKTKTVRYRELFATKLQNEQIIDLFARHGVTIPEAP